MTALAYDAFRSVKHFARHMLRDNRLTLAPLPSQIHVDQHGAMECVLFRSGRWQVCLIVLRPNSVTPRHCHRRVDSCDVLLAGDGAGSVERYQFSASLRGSMDANLMRVPKDAWHQGYTGEKGAAWLSFQMWDGEPDFISTDWEQDADA